MGMCVYDKVGVFVVLMFDGYFFVGCFGMDIDYGGLYQFVQWMCFQYCFDG